MTRPDYLHRASPAEGGNSEKPRTAGHDVSTSGGVRGRTVSVGELGEEAIGTMGPADPYMHLLTCVDLGAFPTDPIDRENASLEGKIITPMFRNQYSWWGYPCQG